MKRAMAKIKATLTRNVGMKVVAFIIAALVWLTVINISDPDKTVVIYNVPINITNESAITDMEMVYDIESPKYVNVTVSGKRSVVGKLSVSDFKATASLEELSKVNSIPVEISLKQNSIARKVTIEKQSVQTLMVSIEELRKQNFDIGVEFSGNTADGYVPSDYTLSRSNVNIKAPTSVLDRISRVVAECELDGIRTDFSKKCNLVLLDRHGKPVKGKNIEMSFKKVLITVNVAKEKEVPVVLNEMGSPAEGYQIKSVKLSQESVKLIGNDDVLGSVNSVIIDSLIDINGASKNFSKVINISKLVPEGVTISGKSEIKVDIEIARLSEKSFKLKVSDINISNEGNKKVKIKGTPKITLQGESDVIDALSFKDIKAGIDVKGLEEGKHTVVLDIELPDGVTLAEDVSVDITIE